MEENNGPVLVLMIGIQGSGKSTFCIQYLQGLERINLDTLHTRNKENIAITEAVAEKKSIVIDNTNPTSEVRAKYILRCRRLGYKIVGFFMQSKLQECIARNEQRTGKQRVPNKAIACTSHILELPAYEEGFDELYFVSMDNGDFIIEEWRTEE